MAFISSLVEQTVKQKRTKPHGRADKWLLSRLNRKIKTADEMYDKCMLRHLGLEIFYDVVSDLKWYEKRAESLAFFSSLGFRTLAGAYYDGDTLDNPSGWLDVLKGTTGASGIMYTTWQNKYDLLAPFGNLVTARGRVK